MLDLPRCSVAAAAAASELAVRLPLAFTVAGEPLQVAMPARERPQPAADWHRLSGRLGGDAVALALRPDALPAAAAAQLGGLTASALPADLRALLLAVLLRELDDSVEVWCGVRPEWQPPGGRGAEFANLLVVSGGAAADGVVALVQLDDGAFARVAKCCRDQPRRQVQLDQLPVALDLLLDYLPLGSRELRALGSGDVILLDRVPPAADEMDAILRIPGGRGFRVQSANGSLRLIAALDGMMDLPDTGPAGSFDDIELPVEFILGRLVLPLARLRELAVGEVLDLGFDATTAVTLRVNGHVVAIGELVRIAERVGVRITELRVTRE